MWSRILVPVVAVVAVSTGSACAIDDAPDDDGAVGGGKHDGGGDHGQTCMDVQHGDGVCHVGLVCGVPDIDCFQVFASDAEAASWISQIHGVATAAASDPLYTRGRALTDRAWAAYTAHNQVGELASRHMSTVVVHDNTLNAWVTGVPEATKVALSIHLHSALLAPAISDEEILGVLFHELAHITKLHVLPEVKEATAQFYLAGGAAEPIGAAQPDDARVRAQVKPWIDLALVAGPYMQPELGDVPYGGDLGALLDEMAGAVPSQCTTEVSELYNLLRQIQTSTGIVDENITVTAQTGQFLDLALDRLVVCNNGYGARSINAVVGGTEWGPHLMKVLAASEHWLLEEDDGLTALRVLVKDRREKLRALAQTLEHDLGVAWGSVRYFSTEEEADDVAAGVSTAQKLAAPGAEMLFYRLLGDRTACDRAITTGSVPYGARLDDAHHATCWRIAHGRQMAAAAASSGMSANVRRPSVVERGPWVPTRPATGEPMY